MSLFALSDLHLSFAAEKPMDIFGQRWQDHALRIEKNWRAAVSEEDTVVLAGDLSWAIDLENAEPDLRFLDALPGRKIISRGNHDYWWATAAKMKAFFAQKGIGSISLLHNNAFSAEGFIICGSRGWYQDEKDAPKTSDYEKIVLREALRLDLSLSEGEKLRGEGQEEMLAFLHFPPVFRSFECPELLDVLTKHGIRRCFFGHIHGVYDFPSVFTHRGIEFRMTSADYLGFLPMKIGENRILTEKQ